MCIACSFKGTRVKTLHRQIAASRARKCQLWQQKLFNNAKNAKSRKTGIAAPYTHFAALQFVALQIVNSEIKLVLVEGFF